MYTGLNPESVQVCCPADYVLHGGDVDIPPPRRKQVSVCGWAVEVLERRAVFNWARQFQRAEGADYAYLVGMWVH